MLRSLVIVGSGPAGLEAARAYREVGGEGEVILVLTDEDLPDNRPPLSKEFLRGESDERRRPIVEEGFYKTNGITLRLGTEVRKLHLDSDGLTLSDATELEYGRLILATGANPASLPAPGADDPGVFSCALTRRRQLRQAALRPTRWLSWAQDSSVARRLPLWRAVVLA